MDKKFPVLLEGVFAALEAAAVDVLTRLSRKGVMEVLQLENCLRKARFSDINLLLDEFNNAAATASLTRYFGCFASNTSRFLGTDKSENWTVEEFWNYTSPHFKQGKGWTYVPIAGSRKIDTYQTFAVFDELVSSESFKATGRGTGTCEYDSVNNCWYIVTYHLSFPIPNPLAKALCNTIAEYETKEKDKNADKIAEELIASLEKEKNDSHKSDKGKSKGGKGK